MKNLNKSIIAIALASSLSSYAIAEDDAKLAQIDKKANEFVEQVKNSDIDPAIKHTAIEVIQDVFIGEIAEITDNFPFYSKKSDMPKIPTLAYKVLGKYDANGYIKLVKDFFAEQQKLPTKTLEAVKITNHYDALIKSYDEIALKAQKLVNPLKSIDQSVRQAYAIDFHQKKLNELQIKLNPTVSDKEHVGIKLTNTSTTHDDTDVVVKLEVKEEGRDVPYHSSEFRLRLKKPLLSGQSTHDLIYCNAKCQSAIALPNAQVTLTPTELITREHGKFSLTRFLVFSRWEQEQSAKAKARLQENVDEITKNSSSFKEEAKKFKGSL